MKQIKTLAELKTSVQQLYGNGSISQQKDIAERTHFHETVVSNYLSGNVAPSKNFLEKFSEVFKDDLTKTPTGVKGIPYLGDIDFQWNGSMDKHVKDYVHLPGFADASFFINVKGDAMKGKYDPGDMVAIKKADKNEIQYGQAYFVVTHSNTVLRSVRKGKDKNSLLLTSENKKIEDLEVKKNDVKALYLVLGKISREVI